MGTTTIRVYWSGLPCRIPGARIYLYFQQLSFLEDSNYEWHVTGASGNATFHENALTVQDLGIALPYEGYMMYSIEGVGNGAPSERFRFRTHYSRKNFSFLKAFKQSYIKLYQSVHQVCNHLVLVN